MSEQWNVRWQDRVAFAEVAEVLGVPTDHIMGKSVVDSRVAVMWTPDTSDLTNILGAVLDRDADGVLVMVGQPAKVEADIQGAIRDALRDELGDPE